MLRRTLVLLLAVGFCLGASACQKASQPGQLAWQPAPFKDAIPAEYGRLVAITTNDQAPGAALLWFESSDQIRIVYVAYSRGQIGDNVVSIPRR